MNSHDTDVKKIDFGTWGPNHPFKLQNLPRFVLHAFAPFAFVALYAKTRRTDATVNEAGQDERP